MIITAGQAWAIVPPVASGYCGRPEVNEGKNLVWEVTKNGGTNYYGDTYDVTIQVNPNANEIVGDNFDMADFDNNFDNDDFSFYVSPWSLAVDNEPFVSITKVTIGEGVTSIGNGAFTRLVYLTEANIPSSIRHIGKWAFSCCTHLTAITLPDGLESIGVRAFMSCNNLTSITIPASVETIERTAFAHSGFRTVWMEGTNPPAIYDKEEESGAFECDNLEAISVPYEAFDAYTDGEGWSPYLNKVLPRGYCGKDDAMTTDVDESKNLTWHVRKFDNQIKVAIEKSAGAMGSCDMADYDDADNKAPWLSALGAEAFAGNTIVAVEDGVTSIGAYAFAGFGPTTAFIGNDVTAIGSHAFDGTGLTELTLPMSVTSLGDAALAGCSALTKLTVKNTTPPTLGADVFKGCTAIDEVSVPTGTQADYLAVEKWRALLEGKILPEAYCGDPSVNEGKNVVWSIVKSDGKTTLVIEKSSIANGTNFNMADYASYQNTVDNVAPWIDARYGKEDETDEYEEEHYFTRGFKYDIESVTIGEGVTSIGNHAFDGSNLTGITIPASMTRIGDAAFANCSAFTTVTMKPTTPPTLGQNVFEETGLSTIIVPKKAIDTYKGQWENSVNVNYADIVIAGNSELPLGVKMLIDGEYGDKTRPMWVSLYLKRPDNLPAGSVVTYRIEGGSDETEGNQDSDGLHLKLCDQIDATQAGELTTLPQWNDGIVGFWFETYNGYESWGHDYFAVIKGQLSEGQTIRVTGIFGPLKRRADGTQTREIYSTTGVLANMEYYVLQNRSEFTDYGKDWEELCSYKYAPPTAYLYPNDFSAAATQPDPRVSTDGVSKTIDALESDIPYPFDMYGQIDAGTLMVHENIGNSDPLTIVIVNKYDAVDAPEGNTSATGNGTDAETRTASVTLQQSYEADYTGQQDEFTYRIVARPLCRDEIEGDNKISDATLRDMVPPSPKYGDNNEITLTADADGNYVGTFTLKQNASITLNFTMPVWASETAGRRHFFYRIEPVDPKPKGAYYIDTQREGDKLGANVYTFEVFVKLGTTSKQTAYVWSAVHNNRENGALVTSPTWKVFDTPVFFAENATNDWITWCDKNVYELNDNFTAYTIDGINGTTVTLSQPLNIVPAYTPVLIKRADNVTTAVTPDFKEKGATSDDLVSTTDTGWSFYGNAGNTLLAAADASFINPDGYKSYVLRSGQFVRVDDNQGLAAHRCVLNVSSNTGNAPQMLMIGETTGISDIKHETLNIKSDDAWYTLDGRRLNGAPTQKGIYINKGIKRVVK